MPTPYEVKCDDCGEELKVTSRQLDSGGDLIVVVLPCETCMYTAAEEAREAAEAAGGNEQ